MSKLPVREAFMLLKAEGLVDIFPNEGPSFFALVHDAQFQRIPGVGIGGAPTGTRKRAVSSLCKKPGCNRQGHGRGAGSQVALLFQRGGQVKPAVQGVRQRQRQTILGDGGIELPGLLKQSTQVGVQRARARVESQGLPVAGHGRV